MPNPFHCDEVMQDAADLADEIRRLGHRVDGSFDPDWTKRIIARALGKYESLLRHISEKAVDQHGKQVWGGSSEWGAAQSRRENIRTSGSYGRGCDTCNECSIDSFMTLSIGNYSGRLMLDLCRKCAERLAQVVDARLEDRRIRENRRKEN